MKSKEKINCSIGILTLNCGDTLERCLKSLKDFREIIICDGNSTDNTLEIAKRYGAKIIKQYDSNEPNLRCAKDKANVRQKNMNAAITRPTAKAMREYFRVIIPLLCDK